ncbi:MAG: hypothetical protein LBI45_04235 [Bacteroidales bacterium]|jgi:hypothetical protein|nr:hypothetical protein [Bacteroidales bacterium]
MKLLSTIKRIRKKGDIALNNACSLEEIIANIVRKEYLLNSSLHSTKMGVANNLEYADRVIVSITTYGKRIHDVHLVIESLLNQTMPPNKIILWLADDEFKETHKPLLLKKQEARGLEIDFCEDLRSYKKLIPTLKKYPNSVIITVDDDILYPYNMVENLYSEYLKNKKCVYCLRAHLMTFDENANLLPYDKWIMDYKGREESMLVFPTSGGGVLYPSDCFHEDILNDDLFNKLAPFADDIWFKTMTLLNMIPCKTVGSSQSFDLTENQDIGLFHKNVVQHYNDVQIKQTFDHYKLWDTVKSIL